MSFSVHIDPEDLARQQLAAAVPSTPVTIPSLDDSEDGPDDNAVPSHHGARDSRQTARQRSERDRAGRAAGASGGRTYAFRRS
jgi:hypothetical protein